VTRHAAAEAPISFGGGGVKMRPRFRFFLESNFLSTFAFNASSSPTTRVTLTLNSSGLHRSIDRFTESAQPSRKMTDDARGACSQRVALRRDVAREVARRPRAAGARARAHRRGYRLGVA
jgi:hypothetical protein